MGVMDSYKKIGGSEVEGEVSSGGGKFMKGVDFDGEGKKVTIVGVEKFTPADPQYGIKNTYGAGGKVVKENWFVKEKILEEGQSFKYKFTVDGEPREFDNNSCSFYFAFTKANPEEGDELTIKRMKNSSTDVVWTLTK